MCRGSVHNRSQMTSKCGKNKEVAHEPQASVTLMFLLHFDVLCDLSLNRPTVTWNLFILFNVRKEKRPIHIPASYRMTARRSVLVWAFFKSQALLFVPASFFFFISTVYSFFEKVFSTCSLAQSRIMGKTFCETASLS